MTRDAAPGDRLVTSCFDRTATRGFADPKIDNCAVCLKPGTELVFDKDIRYDGLFWSRNSKQRLARFRKVDENKYHTHHDAIELPDGKVILLTNLRSGQVAHVVQLPRKRQVMPEGEYEAIQRDIEASHVALVGTSESDLPSWYRRDQLLQHQADVVDSSS